MAKTASRGGAARTAPGNVFEHIELANQRREWEDAKQELLLLKRELADKDAVILQLKTSVRKLQEALGKKDKELQTVFELLRAPQDAELTKSRKQELIDRLVADAQQRAAASEALAEERKRELDKLRYSSKFIRFQELQVEIEECYAEIERLRATVATKSPEPLGKIVGKLRIASLQPQNASIHRSKPQQAQPVAPKPSVIHPNQAQSENCAPASGRSVMPMARTTRPGDSRESFVAKTRRRAVEAEYYKQVRLAQLEAECELEENMHIRATREARRVRQTADQQRQKQHAEKQMMLLQQTMVKYKPIQADLDDAMDDSKSVLECTDRIDAGPSFEPVASADNDANTKSEASPAVTPIAAKDEKIHESAELSTVRSPQDKNEHASTQTEESHTPSQDVNPEMTCLTVLDGAESSQRSPAAVSTAVMDPPAPISPQYDDDDTLADNLGGGEVEQPIDDHADSESEQPRDENPIMDNTSEADQTPAEENSDGDEEVIGVANEHMDTDDNEVDEEEGEIIASEEESRDRPAPSGHDEKLAMYEEDEFDGGEKEIEMEVQESPLTNQKTIEGNTTHHIPPDPLKPSEDDGSAGLVSDENIAHDGEVHEVHIDENTAPVVSKLSSEIDPVPTQTVEFEDSEHVDQPSDAVNPSITMYATPQPSTTPTMGAAELGLGGDVQNESTDTHAGNATQDVAVVPPQRESADSTTVDVRGDQQTDFDAPSAGSTTVDVLPPHDEPKGQLESDGNVSGKSEDATDNEYCTVNSTSTPGRSGVSDTKSEDAVSPSGEGEQDAATSQVHPIHLDPSSTTETPDRIDDASPLDEAASDSDAIYTPEFTPREDSTDGDVEDAATM